MDSNSINNRKLILELRYDAVPSIIDKRGEFVGNLSKINELNCKAWKISNDTIEVFDSDIQENIKKRVFIGLNRLSYIDEEAFESASFFDIFLKIYKIFEEILKTPTIRRIGCRIMGTYSPDGKTVNTPVPKFLNIFDDKALIEDFPVRDVNLTITYSSGRYIIGPIRSDDAWVEQKFKNKDTIHKSGFAIDTDNYIVDDQGKKGVDQSEIKNVFDTSNQVEDTLFSKLSELYGR